MKIPFVRSLLAPALLLAPLAGCEGLLDDGEDQQVQQFAAATARWNALDIDSYTFTLGLACVCGSADELREIVVEVEDGVVVSRVYDDDGEPAPEAIFGDYDTIDELFDVVAEAITQDPDLISVGYHQTYGLPVVMQVDPDTRVADDYLIFEVVDFTPATATGG